MRLGQRQLSLTSVTYTEFSDYNVHHTANDNQGIKGVPGIHEVVLEMTGQTQRRKNRECFK